MNYDFKKRTSVMPSLIVDESDIPKGLALKDMVQHDGWKVFEQLYNQQRNEIINSIKAAVMLKDNDREIAMKSATLLGLDACFGMVSACIEDTEDLLKEPEEVENVPADTE